MSGSPFAGAAPLAHRPLNAIAATVRGGVPQARIKRLLSELLPPLLALHERGRICGDITTASVGLDESGRAHLMAVEALAHPADSKPPITEPGFAPYEFHLQEAQWPRGPWSDIYSLCAVVHSLITGALPPAATQRLECDTYQPLAERELPRYDVEFLRAIDGGLALNPTQRPHSIAVFADSLALVPPADAAEETLPPMAFPGASQRVATAAEPPASARSRRFGLLAVLLLATVAVGVYWWNHLTASDPSVIAASTLVGRVSPQAAPPARTTATGPTVAVAATQAAPAAQGLAPEVSLADKPAEPAPAALAEPTREPPPAAPSRVKVAVQIQPWGEVWVNGVNRGVSPPLRELSLLPGSYSIVVRNADLPPYRTTLDVKAGKPLTLRHHFP